MSENKSISQPTLDNWENEITGLGVYGKDKRLFSNISLPINLTQQQFDNLYRGDFLAKKIVLLPPKEMTREGVTITQTEQITPDIIEVIEEKNDSVKLWLNIRRALQWSRLYRGGVVVMIIEDGRESDQPVDIKAIKRIRGLYDLNSYQIYPVVWQSDPEQPNFLEPTIYQLIAPSSTPVTVKSKEFGDGGAKFHRSRLMIFDAIDLPEHLRLQNNGWGDSILQNIYNTLRNWHQGQDGSATLVSDFAQAVFKIKGLHNKVAASSGTVVSSRMQVMNLARSLINAVVIDADGEEFKREATPLTGLNDLLVQFERAVVAASEMPHTILFGDSPSGLGATGESEEKVWKDSIKADQESKIRPELDTYFKYISNAADGPLQGEKIGYIFNNLWQMSDKEKSEILKNVSEADKNNIQFGVYTPEEARTRYEGGSLTLGISLDEEGMSEFNQVEEPSDE